MGWETVSGSEKELIA